jgi:hypothetical protein
MEISKQEISSRNRKRAPDFCYGNTRERTLEGVKVDVNRYLSGLITYYIGLHVGTEH